MSTFPKDVVMAAEAAQRKWLVPTSVTLAQWALESDYGKSEPAGSNNPFGIKAVGGEAYVEAATHEVVNGQSVATSARFAKYDSLADAFDAHGKLLATNSHYAKAMAARFNADNFANALTGVYATDPKYGEKLIEIMKANNLYEYDQEAQKPVVTLPEEPQQEPVPAKPAAEAPAAAPTLAQDAALLSSLDKTISDLIALKAALGSINAALHTLLGE